MKWEYLNYVGHSNYNDYLNQWYTDEILEDELNKLGEIGWELVSMSQDNKSAWLKRPKVEDEYK